MRALRGESKSGAGYPVSRLGRELRTRENFATAKFYSRKFPRKVTIKSTRKGVFYVYFDKKGIHVMIGCRRRLYDTVSPGGSGISV